MEVLHYEEYRCKISERGGRLHPVFNSRSMALEGDLKLGLTTGLLTPKIFFALVVG